MPTYCTGTTANGTPCRRWATPGSDPPRCAAHPTVGEPAPAGAPRGNQNAVKHGYYRSPAEPPRTVEDIFTGLADRQAQLEQYLNVNLHDLEGEDVIRLIALYAQNASRLSRILRDKRQMGGSTDELEQAISRVLGDLADEWGIETELSGK